MNTKKILVRTATVPSSLAVFCYEQISRLSADYNVHIITSSGPELEMLKKIPGVSVHIVEMQRHISPFKDLKSVFQMYRLLKKIKPDIVHSVTPKAGLVSMLAAKIAGVKYRVHTFTGLIWPTSTGIKRTILKNVDRLLCLCATNIVPESFSVKKAMEEGKITSKPLTVLGFGNLRGIDINYFSPHAHFDTPKIPNIKSCTFVFVGRIVSDKGVNELIAAFDRLTKKYDDVSLLLVGPEEQSLDPLSQETLKTISQNKDIISIGAVTDVRPYLAASKALILPSYREGLPNAVIEAGAMELPCIVSDIPSCKELIQDGYNGIVTGVRSSDDLYNAMRQIRSNINEAKQMGINARQNVINKYDKEKVYAALIDFYSQT